MQKTGNFFCPLSHPNVEENRLRIFVLGSVYEHGAVPPHDAMGVVYVSKNMNLAGTRENKRAETKKSGLPFMIKQKMGHSWSTIMDHGRAATTT